MKEVGPRADSVEDQPSVGIPGPGERGPGGIPGPGEREPGRIPGIRERSPGGIAGSGEREPGGKPGSGERGPGRINRGPGELSARRLMHITQNTPIPSNGTVYRYANALL